MKYKVQDSVLLSPDKKFVRDDIVTPDDLSKAGFDLDFLLNNKSIEGLEGTETPVVPARVKSPVEGQPLIVKPTAVEPTKILSK